MDRTISLVIAFVVFLALAVLFLALSVSLIESYSIDDVGSWAAFAIGITALAGLGFGLAANSISPDGERREVSATAQVATAIVLVLVGLGLLGLGMKVTGESARVLSRGVVYLISGLIVLVAGMAAQSYAPPGPNLFERLTESTFGFDIDDAIILVGFVTSMLGTFLLFDGSDRSIWESVVLASVAAGGALLVLYGIVHGDQREPEGGQQAAAANTIVIGAKSIVRQARLDAEMADKAVDSITEAIKLYESALTPEEKDLWMRRISQHLAAVNEAANQQDGPYERLRRLTSELNGIIASVQQQPPSKSSGGNDGGSHP